MKDFLPKTPLSALLRVILSALFITSFVSKIGALEPVELSIVELGISNWQMAPIFSRFILGIELALGIAFLFNILRKWTFWASQALLFVFSSFLVYTYFKFGNEGDCGCFGTLFEMSPTESLIKNLVMAGLIVAWYFTSKEEWNWKTTWVVSGFALLSIVLPYIVDFPFFDERAQTELEVIDYPLNVETLGTITFSDKTTPDFTKGEYLIAFLNLKCKHCLDASHRLSIFDKQLKLPKIYSVFIGNPDRLLDFQTESRSVFPHYVYPDNKLMKVTGPSYPIIMYIKDGIIKYKWNFLDDQSFQKAFPNKK